MDDIHITPDPLDPHAMDIVRLDPSQEIDMTDDIVSTVDETSPREVDG